MKDEKEEEKKYKQNIFIDINDLTNKRKLLDEKYNELVEMFKNYGKMLDETKEIYDTESANYFRKVSTEFLNLALVKLNTDFKGYIDKLDNTIKSYSEYSNMVKKQVEKGDIDGTL